MTEKQVVRLVAEGDEVVMVNLEAWREGRMKVPAWCCYGSSGPDDYCWTWVCGWEATREACEACEFCLGQNGPAVWRPLRMQEVR